jgi:hypothetical protein
MIDPMRRALTLGIFGLSGCSVTPTLDLMTHSFPSLKGPKKSPISAASIAAIPYSTLGVSVGSFSPAVMVLAHIDGEELTWVSSDRAVLVTRHGRLIRTKGLKRDLLGTEFIGPDPLMSDSWPDDEGQSGAKFNMNLNRENESGIGVISSFSEPKPDVTDTLLNGRVQLLRVDEKIVVHQWRWETTNSFWMKTDGGIVKSRQQFCPEVDPITMEPLKALLA